MATCNPTELLAAGKCFDCLDEGLKQTIKLQLLCEIANRGTRSYTLAELEAMTADQARALGVAYCTDALNPHGVYGSVGAMCYWSGVYWAYTSFGCPIANDIGELLLNFSRYNLLSLGSSPLNSNAQITANSGSGSAFGTAVSTSLFGSSISVVTASTGSTSSGVGGSRSYSLNLNRTEAEARAAMLSFAFVTCDQSTGGDTFFVGCGYETAGASVSTALSGLQTDSTGIYYDESNILGLGSTGSNFYALTRGNGTTFDWVDTGISRTTPHWQMIVLEPVSATTARQLVYTANANGGSLTKHVDRTVTLSSKYQTQFRRIVKNSGGTTRTMTFLGYGRPMSWRMNDLTSTSFPQ